MSLLTGLFLTLSSTAFIFVRLSNISVAQDETSMANQLAAANALDSGTETENTLYLSQCNIDVVISTYPSGSARSFSEDNFCDCSDGLDETRTPACSYLLPGERVFECGQTERNSDVRQGMTVDKDPHNATEGEEEKSDSHAFVFASRINDSVCDCPDCSDEHLLVDGHPSLLVQLGALALSAGNGYLRGKSPD